jgi:hypothetical protein
LQLTRSSWPSPSAKAMTPDQPRIRIIVPVWGKDYVERWLGLAFAALLADGNLPYLKDHSNLELIIMTKAADVATLKNHWRLNELTKCVRVTYITIDEFFPAGRVDYGVPLTLAYGKAIARIGGNELGSFVVLLNADFILSKGSLASLLRRIEAGHTVITAPSIRVPDHVVRPLLQAKLDIDQNVLPMSGRELMKLVNQYPHSAVLGRTLNCNTFVDSNHYHLMYWRVSQDLLIARYFLLMPLCFQVQTRLRSVVCPVDYGFITEVCPNVNFSVLNDSDDLLMLELQEQNSEASLLRLAPSVASPAQRLALLATEIAANAAEWTTAEHRRSAACDLYFHSEDIPPNIGEKAKAFRELVDGILTNLPPPVSHVGHFHWIGALQAYRISCGEGSIPYLLDDPRNLLDAARNPPRAVIADELPAGQGARGSTNILTKFLERIGPSYRHISILYLGDVEGQIRLPSGAFRRFKVPSDALSPPAILPIRLPEAGLPGQSGALAIFGTTDALPHWPKLRQLSDSVLDHNADVFAVFFTPSFTPVVLRHSPWMLSQLLYDFTSDRYETSVETFRSLYLNANATLTEKALAAIRLLPSHPGRVLAGLGRVTGRFATGLLRDPDRIDELPPVAGFLIHLRPRAAAGSQKPGIRFQHTGCSRADGD